MKYPFSESFQPEIPLILSGVIGENKWDVSLFLTQGVREQIKSTGRRKLKIGFDDEGGGGKKEKKKVLLRRHRLCAI